MQLSSPAPIGLISSPAPRTTTRKPVAPINDCINGKAGDDTLDGGPGRDNVQGGTGQDVARGGDGNGDFVSVVDRQTGDFASGGGGVGDICVGDFLSRASNGDTLDGSTCEFTVNIATP